LATIWLKNSDGCWLKSRGKFENNIRSPCTWKEYDSNGNIVKEDTPTKPLFRLLTDEEPDVLVNTREFINQLYNYMGSYCIERQDLLYRTPSENHVPCLYKTNATLEQVKTYADNLHLQIRFPDDEQEEDFFVLEIYVSWSSAADALGRFRWSPNIGVWMEWIQVPIGYYKIRMNPQNNGYIHQGDDEFSVLIYADEKSIDFTAHATDTVNDVMKRLKDHYFIKINALIWNGTKLRSKEKLLACDIKNGDELYAVQVGSNL